MFDKQKAGLGMVFSRRKYAWLALALFFVFLSIYTLLTNVVLINTLYFNPNMPAWQEVPLVSFNPNLTVWNAAPTILLAALSAFGFSIAAFQLGELSAIAPASKTGAIGSLMGTLASACPICQPIWLVWLGMGSMSGFLADWGGYILAASLVILTFSVHQGLQAVATSCPMRKSKR